MVSRPLGWLALGLLASSLTVSAQDAPDPFAGFVVQAEPLPPSEQRARFHVPPGFEVQLVAAEPDIQKPINLAFDRQGRLLATESVEYPFPVPDDRTGRDRVQVLSGIGADGRAAQVKTFADNLSIPIGLVPLHDRLIVYSIPNLWELRDTDADGQADHRRPLYGPFGFQDTHGMCNALRRGLDGWIYACHGFANTSTVQGSDAQAVTMHSGNTYRFRTDGSHLEYHTHGQVNPFGLAFDEWGNLFSADCHSMPIYQLLRGGYYPSFGKPDDGLGFAPAMLEHQHGSTGIAGVVWYGANQFPPEYQQTVFLGNPVTGRVNHDRLERHGSTWRAIEQPDFLVCDDPWFRPVDIRLGSDGALYIADFYTCIIAHYEVPLDHPQRERHRGRIWRVVYRGQPAASAAPAGLVAVAERSLAELVALLADDNIELRTLATHELVDRAGPDVIAAVRALFEASPGTAAPVADSTANTPATRQRAHALWVLDRLGACDAPFLLRLLADDASLIRVHALRALAERDLATAANGTAIAVVRKRLTDPDPLVRRTAVDVLSRHPTADNLQPLLDVWRAAPADDTHLVHATRMALRDQLRAARAFVAAVELANGNTDAAERLLDVSLGLPNESSAAFVLDQLRHATVAPAQAERHLHHVLRHAAEPLLPEAYSFARSHEQADTPTQRAVVRATARALAERGLPTPDWLAVWSQRLARQLLQATEIGQVREGIELCRDLRLRQALDPLLLLAAQPGPHDSLRPAALSAALAIDAPATIPTATALLNDTTSDISLRQHAARELGNLNQPPAIAALVASLPTAPERLSAEIAAALANSDAGTTALVEAAEAGRASPRLLQDWLVRLKMQGKSVPQLAERVARLTASLPPTDDRLLQLVETRRAGFARHAADLLRGQATFDKICAACHRLAGRGTKIGPELDGIGNRGLDRLLEDVLKPSGNVDQAFRTTTLALADGRTQSGLLLREEGNILVLADAQGKELRVPAAEVLERAVSPLSPMPANVADLLTEPEFYDLIAFLLAQRAK